MLRRVRGAHVAFAARLFAKFEAKYEPHLSVKGQATAPYLPQLYITLLHSNSFCFYAISWTTLDPPRRANRKLHALRRPTLLPSKGIPRYHAGRERSERTA